MHVASHLEKVWEWCWTCVLGSTPFMKSVIERHSNGWGLNCNSYMRVLQYRPLAIMKFSWHSIRIWQVLREVLFARSDVQASLHAQNITNIMNTTWSHHTNTCSAIESIRTAMTSDSHISHKDSIEVWHPIASLILLRLQSTKSQFHALPTPQHIHSP